MKNYKHGDTIYHICGNSLQKKIWIEQTKFHHWLNDDQESGKIVTCGNDCIEWKSIVEIPQIDELKNRINELEKCLAKFPQWDTDFPVGYCPMKGLDEFNRIIDEAKTLLNGENQQ